MKQVVLILLVFGGTLLSLTGCQSLAGLDKFPEFNLKNHNISADFTNPADQKLVRAACAGDSRGITAALKAGADIDARGADGNTPLFWAISCKNLSGVRTLLENGADPNVHRDSGFTPVLAAINIRDIRFLKTLLDYGGDPNSSGYTLGNTPQLDDIPSPYYGGTAISTGYALADAEAYGVFYDDWKHFELLLSNGADTSQYFSPEFPPFMKETIFDVLIGDGQDCKALELLNRGFPIKNEARFLYFAKRRPVSVGGKAERCKAEIVSKMERIVSPQDMQEFEVKLEYWRENKVR